MKPTMDLETAADRAIHAIELARAGEYVDPDWVKLLTPGGDTWKVTEYLADDRKIETVVRWRHSGDADILSQRESNSF